MSESLKIQTMMIALQCAEYVFEKDKHQLVVDLGRLSYGLFSS
jgi:hypothetical protein